MVLVVLLVVVVIIRILLILIVVVIVAVIVTRSTTLFDRAATLPRYPVMVAQIAMLHRPLFPEYRLPK